MPLITLTTDYGTKDHFVAALKGQIFKNNPTATIVDINHQIKAFDIISAAYLLKNAANNFPDGTVHIASINIKDGNNRFLIVKKFHNFFIVPDNGIICLMFPDEKFTAYTANGLSKSFNYRELHQFISALIPKIEAEQWDEIGVETTSYKVATQIQAIVMPDLIKGSVIYVDSFENVVINITKEMFEDYVGDQAFIISFRHYKITELSKHYSDVKEGEVLAMFNDAGYLEIGMNRANAAGLLGLEYGSLIMVEAF